MQHIGFFTIFLQASYLLPTIMAIKREIFLQQLGLHLRNLRLSKNITQFDLGSIINKDRQSIQRVESGKVNPTIYYLQELSDGLQIPLSEIVNFKIPEKNKKNKNTR